MTTSILLHLAVLFIVSILLSGVYEAIVGSRSFSLPLSNILLVTTIGTVLSKWWGWTSTIAILALYGLYMVVGGLVDRGPPSDGST